MPARLGVALDERSDDELAMLAQRGDLLGQALLIERYRCLTRTKRRGYYLMGGDADDLEQEGLIGLYKAIRDYRVDREASFRAFAELCVTRQIISAVKTATRRKHQPLNHSVPIGLPAADDGADRAGDELVDVRPAADPLELVIRSERHGALRAAVRRLLSPFEIEVLVLHLEGRPYQEIAARLGRRAKSVDNALQRIKRKLDRDLAAEVEREEAAGALAPAV